MLATEEYTRAHNSPEAFEALPVGEQRAIRLWVRLALEPAERWGTEDDRWHSYNLKRHAERAAGGGCDSLARVARLDSRHCPAAHVAAPHSPPGTPERRAEALPAPFPVGQSTLCPS